MNKLKKIPNDSHIFHKVLKDVDFDKDEQLSTSDYLKVVNVYNGMKENIHFKTAQILDYDWLKEEDVDYLLKNMFLHISEEEVKTMTYENLIIEKKNDNEDNIYEEIDTFTKSINIKHKIRFTAVTDAISNESIWEFKCKGNLEPEDFIQLIIYAWLWNMTSSNKKEPREFKLMNIRTGEVYQLNYKVEPVNKIMEYLFVAKFAKREVKTDEEFIEHHKKIYKEYFSG
jgi:hypothetical protein